MQCSRTPAVPLRRERASILAAAHSHCQSLSLPFSSGLADIRKKPARPDSLSMLLTGETPPATGLSESIPLGQGKTMDNLSGARNQRSVVCCTTVPVLYQERPVIQDRCANVNQRLGDLSRLLQWPRSTLRPGGQTCAEVHAM